MDSDNKPAPVTPDGDKAAQVVNASEPFARGVAYLSPYLFWITVCVLCSGILLIN